MDKLVDSSARAWRAEVVAALVTATMACGGGSGRTVIDPRGTPIGPAAITVSTFWDMVVLACPKIGSRNKPTEMTDRAWENLGKYCAAPEYGKPRLELAFAINREELVEEIVTGNATNALPTISVTDACNATRSQLDRAGGPSERLASVVRAFHDFCASEYRSRSEFKALAATIKSGAKADDASAQLLVSFTTRLRSEMLSPTREAVTPASVTSLGGLATNLVDTALRGLAQFLLKRAEVELRTFAIEKMRKIAQCDDDVPRSRLLANSCYFLGKGEATLGTGFGPGLRAAFANDLLALPRNLIREFAAAGNEKQLLLRLALEGAAVLVEDPEPMQIVVRAETLSRKSGVESFQCNAGKLPNMCEEAKAGLFLAATIAREILTDGKEIRLDAETLIKRLDERLDIVLENINDSTEAHKHLTSLKLYLEAQKDRSVAWQALVGQMREDVKFTIEAFTRARHALNLGAAPTPEDVAIAFVAATRHALTGIDRALAISDCLREVARTLRPARCTATRTRIPPRLLDLMQAIERKDLVAVMAAGLDLARGAIVQAELDAHVTSDMLRLLSFGAELANAKNPEEAEAAIEAVAMPPGGWKEKRKRDILSITSLVGLAVGLERVAGDQRTGFTPAMLGAVGFDYSHPVLDNKCTLGVYLTVIDLGGLLNVRTTDNNPDDGEEGTIEETSPVGFAQVFAPGLGLRFGIWETPLVAMVGAQIVPNGRTVVDDQGTPMDMTDDTSDEKANIRLMLSLSVDVTLWSWSR